MKVFCLFMLYGNGDSETEIELIDIFSSAEKASEGLKIPENFLELCRNGSGRIDFVHKSMSMKKPYYIGKRTDCREETNYSNFGGFVIEEIEVK